MTQKGRAAMGFRLPHDSHSLAAAGLAITCAMVLAACASTQPSSTPSRVAPVKATTTTAPSAPPTTAGATASATAGACALSQLRVGLTHTGAVAGQAGGYLEFSNDSSTPCRITGWPEVTGVTAAGKATPVKHAQSTMFGAWQLASPLPVLTLQPGGAAYAVVASDDAPAGRSPRCPAPYQHLRVGPPGSPASVVISAWLPGASTYLPACTSITGSPTAEESTVTALSSLPH